jgi:hypothetical protein
LLAGGPTASFLLGVACNRGMNSFIAPNSRNNIPIQKNHPIVVDGLKCSMNFVYPIIRIPATIQTQPESLAIER